MALVNCQDEVISVIGTGLLLSLNAVLIMATIIIESSLWCFLSFDSISHMTTHEETLKMLLDTFKSWLWRAVFCTILSLLWSQVSHTVLQQVCLDDVQKSSETWALFWWYADMEPKWCWLCGSCLIVHFSMETDFKPMFCREPITNRICRDAFYACRRLATNHRPVLLFQKQQLDVVVRLVSINLTYSKEESSFPNKL